VFEYQSASELRIVLFYCAKHDQVNGGSLGIPPTESESSDCKQGSILIIKHYLKSHVSMSITHVVGIAVTTWVLWFPWRQVS
jgi:hypothetical protein